MATIFDLTVTPATESRYTSATVLLDPENARIAVGTSLLSCIQAETIVIPYVLAANGGHLDSPVTLASESMVHVSQSVAAPLKCGCRWNLVIIMYSG